MQKKPKTNVKNKLTSARAFVGALFTKAIQIKKGKRTVALLIGVVAVVAAGAVRRARS